MRTLRPDFYERFHCIGGKCTDTCCAGWEIEVDPQTAEAYRQMNTPLGREIAGSCEEDSEGIWFRMTEDGRCPFLNAQGLCRIILQCGEGALCDICREHPRFYNWCADRTEVGLGLSCEEAVRLLFDRTEPIRLLEEDDGEPAEPDAEDGIFALRNEAFRIVQDRAVPITERISRLLDFAADVQKYSGAPDPDRKETPSEVGEEDSIVPDPEVVSLQQILDRFRQLDLMTEEMPRMLEQAQSRADEVLREAPQIPECGENDTEFLLTYFLYRYFGQCAEDGQVLDKVQFGVCSVCMIRLLSVTESLISGTPASEALTERQERPMQAGSERFRDSTAENRKENAPCAGRISAEIRNNVVRIYSKEIEYCEENVDALLQMAHTEEAFGAESLKRLAARLVPAEGSL